MSIILYLKKNKEHDSYSVMLNLRHQKCTFDADDCKHFISFEDAVNITIKRNVEATKRSMIVEFVSKIGTKINLALYGAPPGLGPWRQLPSHTSSHHCIFFIVSIKNVCCVLPLFVYPLNLTFIKEVFRLALGHHFKSDQILNRQQTSDY